MGRRAKSEEKTISETIRVLDREYIHTNYILSSSDSEFTISAYHSAKTETYVNGSNFDCKNDSQ